MATFRRTPNITPPRKSSRTMKAASPSSKTSSRAPTSSTSPSCPATPIKFGATVTLVDEDTEKKTVWQIVGEPEADAKKGRISITSPLARALIGKKKGATVEVVAPGGAKAYEITKVEWR